MEHHCVCSGFYTDPDSFSIMKFLPRTLFHDCLCFVQDRVFGSGGTDVATCAMKSGAIGGTATTCAAVAGCKWTAGMSVGGVTLPGTCSPTFTPTGGVDRVILLKSCKDGCDLAGKVAAAAVGVQTTAATTITSSPIAFAAAVVVAAAMAR